MVQWHRRTFSAPGLTQVPINAAAWLLNIERFDEGSFRAGG
jgi:hypothetical protein